ncbi:efflux RND transporter periplasmic adaptor subunit [Oscillibacter hominis]|uniref:Efflux RND transporter periplasmic adaptor subunit n=2 Tax=Oscillibacter hominis TaxID=2763056 RepID=A0A7G9B885_9FIRM|nr:efflux RND transporter periplasmic adaptor subunit [Oscillibacter hominis]
MDPVLEKKDEALVQPESAAPPAPQKPKKKKKKKIISWVILAVVLGGIAFGMYQLLAPKEEEGQVITDMVQYGSITSTVQGSGITKPKNSETITLTTSGTVADVYVTEGQQVTAGTPLFTIDSEAAREAVEKARKDANGYQKQLDALYKDIAGLNLTPAYGGKLLDVVKLNAGDTISKDQVVAKLVDDSTLRLKQYYSYAYADSIKVGQSANVSVPALMSSGITGTVDAVHMVERISAEGSKLFEVEVTLKNPGTLTADMEASAVITVGGETVYPYESAKLEYNRSTDLKSTVNGTVISSSLLNYMEVTPGQVLVKIDGEDSENEIFSLEQSLATAQKDLETAQKNLANCSAVAPIDGTVIGLAIAPGDEVAANTTVISIADTTTVLIDATVDERNISYVQQGMMVDLDQWGTPFTGMVESVSLSSKVENGVASYPMVISVDNTDGSLMTGSNVTYSLIASENDNCLLLPIQAVKSVPMEDGTTGSVVFVKADSRPENAIDLTVPVEEVPEGFYAIPVETGISDNYHVEIISGVEEGTEVFTTVQKENSWY